MTTPPPPAQTARFARHELIHALVEHSWARPGTLRPAAKPHIVMVSVLTAAAAIAVGAVLQLVHPIRLPARPPAPPRQPAAPRAPLYRCDRLGLRGQQHR